MTDDRSPRLLWSEDGAPRSGRFGDVYFSREDGLAESRAVFLGGCVSSGGVGGRSFFGGRLAGGQSQSGGRGGDQSGDAHWVVLQKGSRGVMNPRSPEITGT